MPTDSTLPDLQSRLADRYRIERLLGRGGMGAVYLARDLTLDRLVAVKELPSEFASDPLLRERFLREVRMAASFSHPNIVPVYSVEAEGDSLAFVMGFVEGESLTERVKRAGPLSARETIRLLLDVAYALAYAHGRGVVHRDLKPDNIMLERVTGRALLMDFGVARAIGAAPAARNGMTRVGEVVGTPEYMSPEQATGEEIDGRSDLYSLGLVGHFAATGNVAFAGESAARILVRQLTELLPPLGTIRPDLPPTLGPSVDKCLAKERDDRFADASALIEALDAAQAAAPEIPLSIRLLANEMSMVQILAAFLMFMLLFSFSLMLTPGTLAGVLPSLVMIAVLFGRFLQSRSEVRRIRAAGFSGDDIHRGLLAVMAEREERRQQLRADATVVAQRKRTRRTALVLLFGAAASFAGRFALREERNGQHYDPGLGITLLFVAMIWFGISVVLLLRNPLKMPADERLFRVLWLSAVGRRLGGYASAQTTEAASVSTRPAIIASSVVTTAPAPSGSIDARLATLEARVDKLERR